MPNVLVVSERDLTFELGGTVLWAAGVDRLVAQSAGAALEAARAFNPAVIVVDGADSDAAHSVRKLRRSPVTRRSSIVVAGTPEHVLGQELRDAGANLVLRGGVDPATCNETLSDLLRIGQRVRTSFGVRFSTHSDSGEGTWLSGQVVDASIGGVLIEAAQAPQKGEMVDVALLLPQGLELHAVGETVRAVPGSPARFGVRLVGLAGDAERQLRDMLRDAQDGSSSAQ